MPEPYPPRPADDAAHAPAAATPAHAADAAAPLLQVQDLRVTLHTHHGDVPPVRGVSFALPRGDTLGLIGESGCGKSMTALALMGLLPAYAQVQGSIRLGGQELAQLPERDWLRVRGNRIGMIFQEPMTALNPLHTVAHQVAEPLRLHRALSRAAARAQAIALLERVGIAGAAARADSYPHQFSGGQRQRILIAAALACGPDLLIADEPTTALDVTMQGQILALIHTLVAERQMALLLISHDLGLMAQNVAELLVMYGGTVVERGPTARVFAAPAHPYTRALFAARPALAARPPGTPPPRLATVPGRVPELIDMPPGCPFAGRCPWTAPACLAAFPPPLALGGGHSVHCVRLHAVHAAPQAAGSAT